jgi:hypothetical protein
MDISSLSIWLENNFEILFDVANYLVNEPTVLILVLVGILIINKLNMNKQLDAEYNHKKEIIQKKYKSKIYDYINVVLMRIHNYSSEKANNVLCNIEADPESRCKYYYNNEEGNDCCKCHNTLIDSNECILQHRKSEVRHQIELFSMTLSIVLNKNIFNAMRDAIYINGFHNLGSEELEEYLNNKSLDLLTIIRNNITFSYNKFPCLYGSEDERFSIDNAKLFLKEIVEYYIEIEQEEKKELEKLEKELLSDASMFYSFKKAIINKLTNN